MRTLQKGKLAVVQTEDGSLRWKYLEEDGSVIYFTEANIVTGPGYVYRASKDMTLTPLKSTIRKNGRTNVLPIRAKFPDHDVLKSEENFFSKNVGYDYRNSRFISIDEVLA